MKKTTQEVKQGEYQFGCWSSPFDFELEFEKTRQDSIARR